MLDIGTEIRSVIPQPFTWAIRFLFGHCCSNRLLKYMDADVEHAKVQCLFIRLYMRDA
jgi:hypothetical protein